MASDPLAAVTRKEIIPALMERICQRATHCDEHPSPIVEAPNAAEPAQGDPHIQGSGYFAFTQAYAHTLPRDNEPTG